jgi:hypothetical protein
MGISRVFTFNSDFRTYGFSVIPYALSVSMN